MMISCSYKLGGDEELDLPSLPLTRQIKIWGSFGTKDLLHRLHSIRCNAKSKDFAKISGWSETFDV